MKGRRTPRRHPDRAGPLAEAGIDPGIAGGSVAIRQLGALVARPHHQRRSGCPHEIAIAGLPGRADPGVTGFPLVHLATSRATQRHRDARQALEQNPFGLEAGRNRSARARTLNQNISQGRAPSMIGDTSRCVPSAPIGWHASKSHQLPCRPITLKATGLSRPRRTAAERQWRFIDDSLPKRCGSPAEISGRWITHALRTLGTPGAAPATAKNRRPSSPSHVSNINKRILSRGTAPPAWIGPTPWLGLNIRRKPSTWICRISPAPWRRWAGLPNGRSPRRSRR